MQVLRYHFAGIAGAGTDPLARLMRSWGHIVQGSDRSYDQLRNQDLCARQQAMGIALVPQDGSGLSPAIDRYVYSTAVEPGSPEAIRARELGLVMQPRPALLADVVAQGAPGCAISGTSGKSTVTAMIAWILRYAARDATVLGGAGLVGEGGGGCFSVGSPGAPVVVEACESDGTLVGYRPGLGVIHNISRDHGEVPELSRQFSTFARSCTDLWVNARSPEAVAAGGEGARRYGGTVRGPGALEIEGTGPDRARGTLLTRAGPISIDLPQPGLHNLENAAAASVVAHELGIDPAVIGQALATFPGVQRRFEVIGVSTSCIRVIDDYAHNGDKIRAAITTAQAGCSRLLAVFHPHGYGPARFLRSELRVLLPEVLRPHDRFCYGPIYYAGGTVTRDIDSATLASDVADLDCGHAKDHQEVLAWVAHEARPGDTVLMMGARDPELPRLARAVLALL